MNIAIIAGIPPILASEFGRSREKVFPGNRFELIWSPLEHHAYTDNYIKRLYKKFSKAALKVSKKQKVIAPIDLSLFVFYVDYPGIDTTNLWSAFFPEAFILAVPPLTLLQPHSNTNQIRAATNTLLDNLRHTLRDAERALNAIRKEVTSNDNKTPLLLPIHNFDNAQIGHLLQKVSRETLEREPFQAIKSIKTEFEHKNPKVSLGKDPRTYFQNSAGIAFKSPGKARHGLAHFTGDGAHPESCFIRSRLRLGAAFDPRFHYDCVKATGAFPKNWSSCHRQRFNTPHGRNHVNIAPNDNVR